MIKVSAFRWVPMFARGYVRDLRVRWALEEIGQPYQTRLLGPDDKNSKEYRAMQPFGQVPAYEEDGLVLFESGAILLHIARKSEVLMPTDTKGQARVSAWMFAALNSIEPQVDHFAGLDVFHAGEEWVEARKPGALKDAQVKLTALSDWLDGRDYLENRFTVADLLMTTVLRTLGDSVVIAELPRLKAYRQRCEARPAFGRALAAQMADFTDTMPAVA